MKINFELETIAYIVASIEENNRKHRIGHSADYGDKFQELLNRFLFIYDCVKQKEVDYFPYRSELIWNDDRVNHKWEISMETLGSPLIITVLKILPSNENVQEKVTEFSIHIKELIDSVFTSLDFMYKEFGFIGYKKVWDIGNFPISEYLTLKAERNGIEMNASVDGLEDDEWKMKIDAVKELAVLQS